DVSNFDDFTRSQVTLLVSGSQGEPRGSFSRIAEGTHGWVSLEPGDTVLLSSRRIPGNELRIGRAINALYRRGVHVLDDRTALIHTSGHAYQGEQRTMFEWTRPEWFIPVHGEYRHMVHHARTAEACGVRRDRIFVTEDGDPITFERANGELRAWRDAQVEAGPVYIGGGSVGLIDDVVLRDRQLLQQNGIVFCVVVIDDDDVIVAGPEIGTRGVFHVAENPEMLQDTVDAVLAGWERVNDPPEDLEGWGQVVKSALKRFFKREYDLRPLLVPVVLRAD
ncbi:MAG: ribonuclease J, partial [Myxococcota bacterium]